MQTCACLGWPGQGWRALALPAGGAEAARGPSARLGRCPAAGHELSPEALQALGFGMSRRR